MKLLKDVFLFLLPSHLYIISFHMLCIKIVFNKVKNKASMCKGLWVHMLQWRYTTGIIVKSCRSLKHDLFYSCSIFNNLMLNLILEVVPIKTSCTWENSDVTDKHTFKRKTNSSSQSSYLQSPDLVLHVSDPGGRCDSLQLLQLRHQSAQPGNDITEITVQLLPLLQVSRSDVRLGAELLSLKELPALDNSWGHTHIYSCRSFLVRTHTDIIQSNLNHHN